MSFLVVANWKMGGDAALMRGVLRALGDDGSFLDQLEARECDVVVCPPYTAIGAFVNFHKRVKLGAQDCFFASHKGCTGEISAEMLRACGCEYVILGHSDRRALLNEDDRVIKSKAEIAITAGLVPIICVGETRDERDSGKTKEVLLRQCEMCLPASGDFFVAYEPVWAIGGTTAPSIEIIGESINIIKSYSPGLNVMYGGSVNGSNICSLKSGISDLRGVLVGSASMQIETFMCMVTNVLVC